MQKPISADDVTPIRVVIITMDRHIAGAVDRAREQVRQDLPGLELSMHAASDWASHPEKLEACIRDIEQGDIIVVAMLFIEEHVQAVLPALKARRDQCDAMLGAVSAGEIVKLTRLGGFKMDGPQKGPMALLKRLRGSKKSSKASAGAQQLAVLRRLPKILRFIPGTAQDVRAYFLSMQYWLGGSDDNIANMVRFLVTRYASGERKSLRGSVKAAQPVEYPDTGLYHPDLPNRIAHGLDELPPPPANCRGTVGVLVLRSYILAGDCAHYDAVVRALEERGFAVRVAFASGLDARPAVEAFFRKDGKTDIDALVSLTSFSLVGGPAFNDSAAAEEVLDQLDVPYISGQALEFQTVREWQDSGRGLLPVESTIMVAIPELDGATGPIVFGGRPGQDGADRAMLPVGDRVDTLAERVARWASLRVKPRSERKVAIVLFNFPPNSGATGTAAYLSVFESLHRTLQAMKVQGYRVEVPATVDELRDRIVQGNAEEYGTDANVCARVSVDDHVRKEKYLKEIEAQWGPAPGREQTDGASLLVLGAEFGNVMVGLQPAFGYEGDPMRLLFESGFAPTHAFSAFYRYLQQDFGADAYVHFGTHGALEFMPGKQCGMSDTCWPDRLIGDVPNIYLYAANNPSEGTIAKRRAAATLISYLTPPVAQAGIYKGLLELKESIDRWRGLPPEDVSERERLMELIQAQAAELELADAEPAWTDETEVKRVSDELQEVQDTLIPCGLHVLGEPGSEQERTDQLLAMAEASSGTRPPEDAVRALVLGSPPKEAWTAAGVEPTAEDVQLFEELSRTATLLETNPEIEALLRALDGRFIRPAPGGDLLRTPDILPTGRNVHGFDPFRIPSKFAVQEGERQARKLLDRYTADGHPLPDSVALVLWGTDNLKTEGGPIGQVLALIGAKPRFDGYGRLAGAELVPLEELGRPRIDVMVTLSGIFRDLMPLQTRMLAEAAYLAATAEEPEEMNHIRRNSLRFQREQGCDMETAALRVFSNADGAYGSNVNQLVDSGAWNEEDELAEAYSRRKCFAYGRSGRPVRQEEMLKSVLSGVKLTYQNLESVELGVTTIDHYFDTLGGIGRAVRRASGEDVPVYIGDTTRGEGTVRTLGEQVTLESRTRMLNPKWYEGLLQHGSEGVRQIEASITNTMGWSATTGQVQPWVYQQLSETYVLDPEMRERLAQLNPKASVKLANRLLEAHERSYWEPDPSTLEALRKAGAELEDRLEGIGNSAVAA